MPGCLFKFHLKGCVLIFEGGRLLHVVLNKLENGLVVSGKFTAFTKSGAIGQKFKEESTSTWI